MLTILALFIVGALSGCSKTWSGIKSDSKSAWKSTKQTVHEATAD
ncbi:entericidin EcnAB [Sulfurovum sp. zt1-1]|uniref:Entericidin EcnAB n=1 Tax=Sulfurovum zhangzhouensis TaxID=3019067 RepID=A0ABT7QXJ2_9BACT|nr:entericidin EcnAB [Sulfurovum zhangzhouensis]MDM5271550.1 entericidin EcnAB [Sulfurovum zhangzhouensis]